MKLHTYFRSSASWRVRIALHWKGVAHDQAFVHLRKGEHRAARYRMVNPQGFVPSLELEDGTILTQSLAILEYLEETHPEPPLLPTDAVTRARIRGFADVIACDVHPVQNLKVFNMLKAGGYSEAGTNAWAVEVIAAGFAACEKLLADSTSTFCFGESPTFADVCLVPQMFNARRFGVDLVAYPALTQREAACHALAAFNETAPERQGDAE